MYDLVCVYHCHNDTLLKACMGFRMVLLFICVIIITIHISYDISWHGIIEYMIYCYIDVLV